MAGGGHVLAALYGAYWAMDEAKFDAMLAFLDERAAGARFSGEEIRARVGEGRQRVVAPEGSGVAVLPVFGLISHRAHLVQDTSGPGGTSTELLGQEFDAALANDKIGTIVLDVSSPGGSVYGVQELADKIYAGRSVKRIIAVSNAMAASAAYWIASAATELVVTPSGEVGSIGVYAVHTNTERRDANSGVERTVLKAGRYKAEGAYSALPADAKAYQIQQLDEYLQAFGAAVGRNRGVGTAVALGPTFGEGRTVMARQAVALKMADRVATLEEVLQELGIGAGAKGRPMRASGRAAAVEVAEVAAAAAEVAEVAAASAQAELPVTFAEFNAAQVQRIADALGIALGGGSGEGQAQIFDVPCRGAAIEVSHDSPATSAELAHQELPVSTQVQNGPGNAGPTVDGGAVVALDRVTRIVEMCALVGADATTLAGHLSSGATPEAVRASLQAGRAKPSPVVSVHSMVDLAADRKFANLGEQLVAIVQAGKPGGRVDPRLAAVNAAASGMNEGVGSEGGFFLEPELLPGVIEPVYEQDPLLSRVRKVPIGANKNSIKFNVVDETSRANGSRYGGMQMYWASEADTAQAKKPKLRQMLLDLKKLIGIGYLTEEMQEDAPAAGDLLTNAFQNELRFMLGDGVFRGSGGGQMLGFLNSGAVVSQAIEAAQTIANSPASIAINTSKMLSRLPAGLWGEAIFLFNPELLPTIVTATVGNAPVYLGASGIAGSAFGTLWGLPAFPSEFCEAVGTPGDIVLIAPSQYAMADKSNQGKISFSPHVRFIYDEGTMKITHRVDGAPMWAQPVTPYKGAATRSAYITLATRA